MRSFFTLFLFSFFCIGTKAQVNVFTSSNGGFESNTNTLAANGWTDVSASNSKWYVGNVAVASGNYGAYIDKNATAGSTNTYNNNSAFISHFYKDFTIPAGAVAVLTFKWRCGGEAADNLRVYVVPTTTTITAGTAPSTGLVGGPYYNQATTFQNESVALTGVAGNTRRLVFTWTQNANNTGGNPPAAVDDVQITYTFPCTGTPAAGTITAGTSSFCGSGSTTLTVTGASTAADITHQWEYNNGGGWTNTGSSITTLNTGTLTTTTQYRVTTKCTASNMSATAGPITVTVNPSPDVNVSPVDTFLCASGASVTLTASGTASSYSWAPGTNLNTTTGSTVVATPSASRAYVVTGTLGPCTSTALALVHIGTPPAITTTATPSTICSGSSVQLATSQAPTGYEVYSIAPYTLTPSTTTTAFSYPSVPPANSNFDDGRTAAIPLPFNFTFFGNTQTQIWLGTNGVVAFTQANIVEYLQQNLPDGANPDNLIALFWHDLDFTGGGICAYGTVGTAPNRKFVISYTNVPDIGNTTADNTGQIVLHETSNYIDVIVQQSLVSEHKTLGIENATATAGVTPTGKNDNIWIVTTTPEAYRFAMPSYTYAWTPSTNLNNTNTYNPTASNLTSSVTYSVGVKNSVTQCVATGTAAVTVNQLPTATIAAGATPICDGQTSTVTVSGTPGATVYYNIDGGATQQVTLDGAGNATLTTSILNTAVTYNLQSATSMQNCSQALSGSATINVNIRPTASISGSQTICNGATAFTMISLGQGTPPWTVTYTDGSNTFSQTSSFTSFVLSQSPSVTTTYMLTGLVDANCTSVPADLSGSATITVNPRPTATLSTTVPMICEGSSTNLVVTLTGSAPYNFDIYDGTVNTSYTNIASNTYSIPVAPAANTTYSISYLQDVNCQGQGADLGNPVTLGFNVRPTASISGSATICNGNNTPITVNLTGTGPWNVSYSNGVNATTVNNIATSPYIFNVSPSSSTTYTLSSVSDINCSAVQTDMSGNATVVVNYSPAITTQPMNVGGCAGDAATFSVSATGTNLTYQWLENGMPLSNIGIYSGVSTPVLSISSIVGLNGKTYAVQISGTCPPVITSNIVTLSVATTNDWTGAVNKNWSNPGNWACGILPNVYTDVTITPSAPNQPEVDIPNAICRSLLIYAGSSVEIIGVNNALEVKTDIVNLGIFDVDAGRVILSGSGPQYVPGVVYKRLEVQGGSVKSFSGNVVIATDLALFSGYISLGQNNLTLAQNATVSGGGPSSFIVTDGAGRVVGDNMGAGARTGTVLFPVGSNVSSYTPVYISNSGVADDINVRVTDGIYQNYNGEVPVGNAFTNNAVNKTWLIQESIPGGSNATITPEWTYVDQLPGFDPNSCAVSHYINDVIWTAGPMTPATGFSPYTQTMTGVSSFSPFGVSSIGGPLALGLLSFTGVVENTAGRLSWVTTNEENMQRYEVERSLDKGLNFEKTGSVPATGNDKTGANSYKFTDANITGLGADRILYRLKMLDNTSKAQYSNIVALTPDKPVHVGAASLYPNPVTGKSLFVKLGEATTAPISVHVTDISGKKLSVTSYDAGSYSSDAVNVDVSGLAQGMYLIRIVNEDNQTTEILKFQRQ